MATRSPRFRLRQLSLSALCAARLQLRYGPLGQLDLEQRKLRQSRRDTGTYTWTWGTGAEQSFTLIIGNTVNAPEPGALGMFGLGVLMIGAFVDLRRRVA